MMKKKGFFAALLTALMLTGTLTAGISASAEETSTEEAPAEEAAAEKSSDEFVRSYLTGKLVPESIGRTRPIAVMINNIEAALPQSGISNAEVVYEAPVEGNITRLMAIMEDYQDVERIGSVRSCREYYVYFAREFEAIYLHYGHAVYATHILNLESTLRLTGMQDYDLVYDGEGEIVYYRSDDFESPHNVFTNYEMIQDGIAYKGYSMEYPSDYTGHYQFADDDQPVTLSDGQPANYVAPGYSYNNAYFIYDESTGKYTRYQYDDVQIDYLTGNALTYNNIIFQYCSWTKWDDNGYLDIDVYSGGSGKYITNGKAVDITWSKDGAIAPSDGDEYPEANFGITHYYDADGNEITLNQGKTWVCIILDSSADDITISE